MSRLGTTPSERATNAAHALCEDPALAPVVEAHGPLTLEPAPDPFRRLVVSLVRQQLSMDAAEAIRERLFEAVEITPSGVLEAEPETLQETGLSAAKTEYVRNVATAFRERRYDRESFAQLSDREVIEELSSIRGVGPWTAKMFLVFALARPDVFPVEDLGVRRAMETLYGDASHTEMTDRAENWRPYRSYAALYLWRAHEG